MLSLIARARAEERGSAMITALLCTVITLGLGLALLSIVDTQARESGNDRTRDRGFNLSESVLTSQAFVLGRNWPDIVPVGNPACAAEGAGFNDEIGASTPASAASGRLLGNLNASYTDAAYAGATWQVNICDDVDGSTVWSDGLLSNPSWDANANEKVWVRAQSTVGGKTRALVGLVQVRTTPALNSKFGLVSGGLTDDLGTTVNTLGSNMLGGVLGGLLGTTPTVAADPAKTPSGVTGLRCGLADIQAIPASTCVAGTIGALGALPVVSNLLTGGRIEQFPSRTAMSPDAIRQLRSQAKGPSGQYIAQIAAGAANCGITLPSDPDAVVFVERIGNGDQSCVVNVGAGVQYKALVIGSGRLVLRGNGTTTAAPQRSVSVPQTNTFSGVVYALNQQRHPVAEGGEGLGDAASPGREVVRIENGAHVLGGVYADGRSAKVGIYPPNLTVNTNSLVSSLLCPGALCALAPTLNGLVGTLGVGGTIDALVNGACLVRVLGICTVSLPGLGVTAVVNGLVGQLNPQRAAYGSAITAHVDAIDRIVVYGASGVVPGSFRDLQSR